MTENTSQPAAEFKADFNDLNYFKNIYHQEYIRTAHQSGKKYRSLNGAVQRAVVEKAMLRTEAYKFSRYGQGELNELTPEKRKERTEFIFQKYCTFYAYSDESRKYRRGLQDILTEEQTFLYLHPMEKDRRQCPAGKNPPNGTGNRCRTVSRLRHHPFLPPASGTGTVKRFSKRNRTVPFFFPFTKTYCFFPHPRLSYL